VLNDLKVLELASVLAGPSVGQFFAELGAEVIKVENLKTGGDVTRSWKSADEQTDDRSAYFCSVNWGKKSIALDLTSAEGKVIVQKLAAQADIIIASYKPGDAEKLGVAYKQLVNARGRFPLGTKGAARGLIYGQITGYGLDNDRVGYDAVLQAESGFMDLNGEKNGPPTKMPVALIDVLAGHQLKEGLLLALLNRERTGKGCLVEVSLIETAVSSLVNQASNWLVANKLPTRQGSAHPNIAPYGESFETADGKRVLLAIGSDRQFQDLCAILGLKPDGRFATNQLRVANRVALAQLFAPAFKSRQANELMAQIHRKKIPAGIIQTVKEALLMPEVESTFIQSDSLIGIKSFIALFTGILVDNTKGILPPPHFGEHTQEILVSL
jgi:crotonobetainyl-CoA:carnitine CoA-transferase CaiB-like acyl-CoA transferase